MNKLGGSISVVSGPSLGLWLLVAGMPVSAQPPVVPSMVLTMPGLGITMTNTPSAAAYHLGSDGRTWELTSPWTYYLPGSAGQVTFQDLRFDTDPLVYNNILVQNLTAVPQVYSIGVFLPTTFGAPNQI